MVRSTRDVVERVEQIRAQADDDERAHGMTDKLHVEVLRVIAEGLVPLDLAPDLAAAALVTEEVTVARWRACA